MHVVTLNLHRKRCCVRLQEIAVTCLKNATQLEEEAFKEVDIIDKTQVDNSETSK